MSSHENPSAETDPAENTPAEESADDMSRPATSASEGTPTGEGTPVKVTRRPKIVPFLLTGAIIGSLIGLIVSLLGPDAPNVSAGSIHLFFSVVGALLGVVAGAAVLTFVDREPRR